MNSTSEDIKDMLEADSSLGLTFATNLFIAREPPQPNDTVTIFDTTGSPIDSTLDQKYYERTSVQLRARSKDFQTAWAKLEAIKNTLLGRAQETWSGTLYTSIQVASGPALFDWDENNRVRLIMNINIQRR